MKIHKFLKSEVEKLEKSENSHQIQNTLFSILNFLSISGFER